MYDFYIGGPMRGYKDLNKPMFTLAANLLRRMGFTVWSPSEHKSYLQLSFGQVMTIDLNKIINECQKIALLPGWRRSLGANAEVFSAFVCNKEAVEIIFNKGKVECSDCHVPKIVELMSIDLNNYCLPYQDGKTHSFNPHHCDLSSFTLNS